jgi:hypothetical protein
LNYFDKWVAPMTCAKLVGLVVYWPKYLIFLTAKLRLMTKELDGILLITSPFSFQIFPTINQYSNTNEEY